MPSLLTGDGYPVSAIGALLALEVVSVCPICLEEPLFGSTALSNCSMGKESEADL